VVGIWLNKPLKLQQFIAFDALSGGSGQGILGKMEIVENLQTLTSRFVMERKSTCFFELSSI